MDAARRRNLAVNVNEFGAKGDDATDDTAAIAAAAAVAAATGRPFAFPVAGVYRVTPSIDGAIPLDDGSHVILSAGAVIKAVEGTADPAGAIFGVTGGRVRIEGGTISGPDAYGAGGATTGVYTVGRIADLRVDGTRFFGLSYGVRATAETIHITDCEFDGNYVGNGGRICTGVHNGTDNDDTVIVNSCRFRRLGSTDGLSHGIYVHPAVSLICTDSRFTEHSTTAVSGRYITIHNGNGAARRCHIARCYFGPYTAGVDFSILTPPRTAATIRDCVFEGPKAVNAFWDTLIEGCVIATTEPNSLAIEDHSAVEPAYATKRITIRDCTFRGDGRLWDIGINDEAVHLLVEGNAFFGNSANHLNVSGPDHRTTIVDNLFAGSTQEAMRLNDGRHVVRGNRFTNPGTALRSAVSVADLTVESNDFSQAGVSIFLAAAPAAWRARGNFGTVGFKSRNEGTMARIDGQTIPHGLGSANANITPTRYGANATVPDHVAQIVAVAPATLTLALRDAAGNPIGVAENVTWWAEQ